MKTSRLCALMLVLIGIAAFCGGAFAEDLVPGITILQVTGGGYLANGYKCGIAVVKKDSGQVAGSSPMHICRCNREKALSSSEAGIRLQSRGHYCNLSRCNQCDYYLSGRKADWSDQRRSGRSDE